MVTRPTAMAPDASTSPVDWGPEIRVDGKRPEWLADDQQFKVVDLSGYEWSDIYTASGIASWKYGTDNLVGAIRLPAHHPHYRKPTTPELDPALGEIRDLDAARKHDAALWDRMVALVRRIADGFYMHAVNGDGIAEAEAVMLAQGIVRDLPKLVDPDEQYAADLIRAQGWQGEGPIGEAAVLSMLAQAYRNGRELAAPEVSHVG